MKDRDIKSHKIIENLKRSLKTITPQKVYLFFIKENIDEKLIGEYQTAFFVQKVFLKKQRVTLDNIDIMLRDLGDRHTEAKAYLLL